ncbi:response regulator transcription factor [Candidatus Leptofilum sp.]|uniref:response regulator transcription factor n=1 Tax=Candidatus Leptofilum sp. TaxID=3241576 RepID=UPI003B5BD8FF
MSDSIRVLITDDHSIVREGLTLILETAENIEVVGEAADGTVALQLVAEKQPDVVLMDLRMPGMDGLTAIQHLQRDYPEVAVVILTTYNEDDLMLRGLQAGAKGFLLKDTPRDTLLDTIQAAAKGESLLNADVMGRLLVHTQAGGKRPSIPKESPLTERELQTLRAVAEGETNKGIALQLGITERTVKAHLTSVYNKLGVDSRAAAIAIAAQQGLL